MRVFLLKDRKKDCLKVILSKGYHISASPQIAVKEYDTPAIRQLVAQIEALPLDQPALKDMLKLTLKALAEAALAGADLIEKEGAEEITLPRPLPGPDPRSTEQVTIHQLRYDD